MTNRREEHVLHNRLGRGLLATILVGTLAIPAAAVFAGPNKRLEKLESEQEIYEGKRLDLEGDAAELQSKIDRLNGRLVQLQIEVQDLRDKTKVARAELRGARERIKETQAEIDEVQKDATAQAVALYKAGATETLNLLLGSGTLAELDDQVEMLNLAQEESTYALVKYGRLKVTIKTQNQALFEREARLASVLEERRERIEEQKANRRELHASLDQLNKRLGKVRNKEVITEREIAEITGGMVAYQAKTAAESLGTSASGYIWPLNGRVTSYYGPRWGRMHSGIDVDGYTGQPIVASKEGRVRLAGWHSGYGQAVIIDHGGGYATLYAHLSRLGTSTGAQVSRGQLIGYVGCTGSCTGDHLHFEVRVNDRPTDPMGYLP